MNIHQPAPINAQPRRAPMGIQSVRNVAAAALLCLVSIAAPACPTLTASGVITEGAKFVLDDESFAATPWNLQIAQVAATGAITGTMTTNIYGGTDYPVNGTVTGSGTLEIAFTYFVGGSPEILGSGVTYAYSGAVMYANTSCQLFIAGTYTSTYYSLEETVLGPRMTPHTSAPMPFSGQYAPIFY